MVNSLSELFGDDLAQMIELSGLATLPEYQGRGYATALVHMATRLVGMVSLDPEDTTYI